MARWSEFARAAPRLAEIVRDLLHQYGPGLGYLATVRSDGGPRVHPVSPVVHEGRLYCFIVASPKRHDLERDGRYALHTFPSDRDDEEAYLAGRAARVVQPALVARLAAAMRAEPTVDWWLYELTVEVAMVVRRGMSSAVMPATPLEVSASAPVKVSSAVSSSSEREIWRDAAVRSRPRAVDSVQ
jgi:hypothetical protein